MYFLVQNACNCNYLLVNIYTKFFSSKYLILFLKCWVCFILYVCALFIFATMRIFFAWDNNQQWQPVTVSRCGLIWCLTTTCGLAVVTSWRGRCVRGGRVSKMRTATGRQKRARSSEVAQRRRRRTDTSTIATHAGPALPAYCLSVWQLTAECER